MKNTLRDIFHSPKFVVGFVIFVFILLFSWLYPLYNSGSPLEILSVGTFATPGKYVSVYDAINTSPETLRIPGADDKRLEKYLSSEDRVAMVEWFAAMEIDTSELDITDTDAMLDLWNANYTEDSKPKGFTMAKRNYYKRLNRNLQEVRSADTLTVADTDAETGELVEKSKVSKTDYVNISSVANVKSLPLGTDNFGRDVLKELVAATKVSLKIGLVAGTIATLIGLTFGLLSGYIGGLFDDIVMFITNLFTVIPSFVLLILISYSIGQEHRGPMTVALVIGLTSWTWTTRSVRSQVISLRNRDHVNLSKLSGHSLPRIVVTDILPYIASYVVMAFILQVSSGILAEAQLSMLGMGPKTTVSPTLGLMMNWAMLYSAHTNGSWWAYFPVILVITLISFSLNLMNTGLDQVFNPTLRD